MASPEGLTASDHAQNRRDADTAGDEHVVRGGLVQREIVARPGNEQRIAGAKDLMQMARSPRLLSPLFTAIT